MPENTEPAVHRGAACGRMLRFTYHFARQFRARARDALQSGQVLKLIADNIGVQVDYADGAAELWEGRVLKQSPA